MAFTSEQASDYLRRAHEQDRLAHAYLISGPAGSGKLELVNSIAAVVSKGNDARVHIAEPESKSRRIVVDQVRALEHALQMRAAPGQRKVAAMIDADRMQPQAANAFLKTLEEPPAHSLLLLVTSLPEALPDTILSRCIAITLAPRAKAERSAVEAELIEMLNRAIASKNPVQAAYLCAGQFQQLLRQLRDAIQQHHNDSLKTEETRYKQTTDGEWLDHREEYYKALTESEYLQRRARMIEVIYAWWGDALRAKNGIARSELPEVRPHTAKVADRLGQPEILRRIRRVEELREQLDRNIQEALAIEVAFLAIYGRTPATS